MNKLLSPLLLILVLMASLVACATNVGSPTPVNMQVGDGGFLTGEPCGPPCFFGIQPRKSNKIEVEHFVSEHNLAGICKDFDTTRESGTRGVMCRGIVVFGFDSAGYVDDLGFVPTIQITFGDVIKKYGNPDAYVITLLGIPESPQETSATLFFDRYNMTLNAQEQSGRTYFLDDTVLIENVGYGSADSYAASRRYSAPWKGFGKFDPTVLK